MNPYKYYMYKQAANVGQLLFELNSSIGKGNSVFNIPKAISSLVTRITRTNPNISQTQALQYLRETANRFKYDPKLTGALDTALKRVGASPLEQGKVDQGLFDTINSVSSRLNKSQRQNLKADVNKLGDKIGGKFPWGFALGVGGGVAGVGALGAHGYYSRKERENYDNYY